ncbi:MAG: hypothetical protein E6I14_09475 [Chloroflexi bacterium]|nr:MAG: hypothetical protein E6I14_09475 [Chloroflexota bacterium]
MYRGVVRLALAAAVALAACAPIEAQPNRTFTFGSSPSATVAGATWRRIADVTTPRSEVASAVFRGVVYVVGGFGGGNVITRWPPESTRPGRRAFTFLVAT